MDILHTLCFFFMNTDLKLMAMHIEHRISSENDFWKDVKAETYVKFCNI